MKCGLLVFAAAALSSSQVLAGEVQSVYVAPGGVYIASARVIVAPGGGAPYVAPDAAYTGPGYAPPPVYEGPGYGAGYAPPPPAYAEPAPAPAYYGNPGYPPPVYGPPGYAGAAPGYGQPGYPPSAYGTPGYPAPGYGAPGYAAPAPYGAPVAARASYGRPAVYAERRLTSVNAYAAEGPPRPPAAIPRTGGARCVVNLGNGRWASCN